MGKRKVGGWVCAWHGCVGISTWAKQRTHTRLCITVVQGGAAARAQSRSA
jgi:hypothetical protein